MTIVAATDPLADGAAATAPPGLALHKFVKADSWRGALTPDSTGANLPRIGSAWIYQKEVLVLPSDKRVGATSAQIAQGVAERGYFLFPIADDV